MSLSSKQAQAPLIDSARSDSPPGPSRRSRAAHAARRHCSALRARLQHSLEESAEYARPNLFLVGLVAVIGQPLYYVMWTMSFPQSYENLPLRLIGAAVAVPLLFIGRLPASCYRHVTLYWLFGLTYEFPFFFTFMLLQNDLSMVWGMSTMAGYFLLVLLVYDWLMITLMMAVGASLAWLCFHFTGGSLSGGPQHYLVQLPIYVFTLIAGSIFNYKAEMVKQEKLQAMAAVGSTIAHELRTPLLGIRSGIRGLDRYVPQLLEGYDAALQHGLVEQRIRPAHYRQLRSVPARIEAETQYSNIVIDMLLLNAGKTRIDTDNFRLISMADCIHAAMERYPFKSDQERQSISYSSEPNFIFWGSDLLMVHVLFNLIKNALQFVAAAGAGDIRVWVERAQRGHRLHFYDTGQGVAPETLPHIFDRFYSSHTDENSAGIGLAFCRLVMESFDGRIECRSEVGQFTEFVMFFPGA